MLDIIILILLILFLVSWLLLFIMRRHLIKRMVNKFGKILMEEIVIRRIYLKW